MTNWILKEITLSTLAKFSNITDYVSKDEYTCHNMQFDFCKANNEKLKYLSQALRWFQAISCLKTALNVSEIILLGSSW